MNRGGGQHETIKRIEAQKRSFEHGEFRRSDYINGLSSSTGGDDEKWTKTTTSRL